MMAVYRDVHNNGVGRSGSVLLHGPVSPGVTGGNSSVAFIAATYFLVDLAVVILFYIYLNKMKPLQKDNFSGNCLLVIVSPFVGEDLRQQTSCLFDWQHFLSDLSE